jgi:hypothetical protein
MFWERKYQMIEAVIFSYKNKNLKAVVDNLLNNTKNEIFITVFDKHNLKRDSLFNSSSYENKVKYEHTSWDEIIGPAEYKGNLLNSSESKYFLIISDDIFVSKNWDVELINFLKDENAIVSGSGKLQLAQKNLFFLKQSRFFTNEYTSSYFIDRNFIFGKTESLKNVYPIEVKYYGEEEKLSLNLFKKRIKIYSAPSDFYQDLGVRTFENLYTTFSLEHNYNLVIDSLINAPEEFLQLINLNRNNLYRLPYNKDDVSYNPDIFDYQDIDGRKFINITRGIS